MRSHALLGTALLAGCSQARLNYHKRVNSTSSASTLSTGTSSGSTSASEDAKTSSSLSSSSLSSSSLSSSSLVSSSLSSNSVGSSEGVAPSPIFITLSADTSLSPSPSSSVSETASTPSPIFITLSADTTSSSPSPSESASTPSPIFITLSADSTTLPSTNSSTSSTLVTSSTLSSSGSKSGSSSASSSAANTTTLDPSLCTGCILEALNPSTAYFEADGATTWTSVVVTSTIVENIITYMDGSTINGITTETQTINKTETVIGTANNTVLYTTPVFVVEPTPGVSITLPVGPTYLVYTGIFGAMEEPNTRPPITFIEYSRPTCEATVTSLSNLLPTRTEDWSYFIQTLAGSALPGKSNAALPLPPAIIDFLKQDPDINNLFNGSDIAECTQRDPTTTRTAAGSPVFTFSNRPTGRPPLTVGNPTEEPPTEHPTEEPPAFPSPSAPMATPPSVTNTFIGTEYTTTSNHITRRGCLRCDVTPAPIPKPPFPSNEPEVSNNVNNGPIPSDIQDPPQDPPSQGPSRADDRPPQTQNPGNQAPEPTQGPSRVDDRPPQTQNPGNQAPEPTQGSQNLGDFIASIVNDPAFTPSPQAPPNNPQPERTNSGQTITIGDQTFEIHPAEGTTAQPNQPGQPTEPVAVPEPTQPGQPNEPGQQNEAETVIPGVVIGSETLTPGQTTTINGVPVVVPSEDGGSRIVVDGSTIAVQPAPTGPPVLTIGDETVTANSQGQFIVGTATLTPGGDPVIVDGSTLSLGPSGTFAVVNGVTQTLANAPIITPAPVLTVDGQTISATIIGGSTVFALGDDQTLTPGGVVTIDGTTFSMPADASGSTVVINGVTSTLEAAASPVLTFGGQSVTATVQDGTTAFILGPQETLTPGGEVVVSGTTFSMPGSASGSVLVVNGVTSTLEAAGSPVLTFGGQSVTATVQDGTTAFILGPQETLTPGGEVIVSGTTFSMPESASGSVLVVNGVTSTLSAPSLPIMTLNGNSITASIVDGTTAFILGPGETLTPGGVVTHSGTTYSMPASASGSVVVINGVTSTLGQPPITAAPALTIDGTTYSASIRDGTTEYVLNDSTTLKPGEAITVSGTTYSLDEEGTALVINGKTSTLPKLPATNSATTTRSSRSSQSTGASSSESSSAEESRNPGDFIASGIGVPSNGAGGMRIAAAGSGGFDRWVKGLVVGFAGWMLMLL